MSSVTRLTVEADHDSLKPLAEKIAQAKDCEAAAYMDWIEAEAASKAAAEKAKQAKLLWGDAAVATASAQDAHQARLDEMTRPAGYEEVSADG